MTLRFIQELLADSGKLVALISIFIYVLNSKRHSTTFNVIIIYLFLNLLISIGAGMLWERKTNNLPLLHLNTFLELILFSLFYKSILFEIKWVQKHFWNFIIFVSILVISNSIFLQPISGFNSNAKTLVQLILISYAVIYIYSYSLKLEEINQKTQAIRLINAAVLIYYSSSLFIFLFSNMFLLNDIKIHKGFWVVNAGLNLIFQVLILIAIWKVVFRQTKSI